MLNARATWAVLRAGDLGARLRTLRDGQATLRLHIGAAALATGVLASLREGALATEELAARTGASARRPFEALLRVFAAAGLISDRGGRWRLARRGRALLDDEWVRAAHEAFTSYQVDLYREIGPLLAGGPLRRDVDRHGGLIARLSTGFEPFVLGDLTRRISTVGPRRVLDAGCGAGVNLATMLSAAPGATGVGVDTDPDAVALAEGTLRAWRLTDRARVVHADVRDLVRERADALAEPFDVVLLANVVYYLPPTERVDLLRDLAGLLAPGGVVLVVTTVAEATLGSRHLDLLFRAQEGQMQLPDDGELRTLLRDAGLGSVEVTRLLPGAPLAMASGSAPAAEAAATRR
ncbi:methyltransferase domain-containing protein [Geodermatophilus sp. YIM 151500]|uniref:class I SAM-dependent methyltransferase n=1 Tax=Geodermatophilus sp. YIM 151500 TaxID=2984531 RepID=UPI0021E4A152|nr:methyltransferase domain-containing protein [Geodermatophilus sp. YIM 151500]MCV2490682.1 methyltransferase domain-containing protein [Geodermatophilus sp. YIM 151500]